MGCLVSLRGFAQDPEFTQFYANPLYLNPAFAGSSKCPRIVTNYRNQWPGISGNFVTYSASYDQRVDKLNGGIGFLVTNDRAGQGTLNTTNISGIYSYQLNITREFSIQAALQGTYAQKALDRSKLTFNDMIDNKDGFVFGTAEKNGSQKINNFDISTGILGFSKKYFAGVSFHHLTRPNESFNGGSSPLPMKITAHAGAIIPLQGSGGDATISPNIIYQSQGKFQQLNLGVYLTKGPIVGGLWYRNKDSFIALVGIQKDMYKFGYSYDVTVSRLSQKTAGSHELSFAYVMDCKSKKKKFSTISCPTF